MSGYLSLMNGSTVPVRHGLVIGRVAGCDVVVDDHKASRRHARVIVENGVVEIEDLDSSNGTLLNGKPVTRRVLRSGDEVQIGKTVIVYREGAVAAGGSAPTGPTAGTVFAADDDLLSGPGPAVDAPAAAAPRARVPSPSPPPPKPAAPLGPPSAPPQAPRPAVVEFADEVVEVKKAPPPARKEAVGAATAPTIQRSQGVLQFSKQAAGTGVLGDDLTQMSSGTRSLLYAAVLAGAIGVAWLVMRAVG